MNRIDIARRVAPLFALILIGVMLLVVVPASCRRQHRAEATARVERGNARAAADSGHDAVETAGRAVQREAAGQHTTIINGEEIRHAEGADAPVVAAVRAAGIDGLCRRDAYRGDPRCLRRAVAVDVESGRAGGAAARR